MEKYFNGHSDTSYWYWASAGKTLTSFITGIAQQEGYLNIYDTTSNYLGSGWTNCVPTDEEKITIWNPIDYDIWIRYQVTDPFCTDDMSKLLS